MYDVIYNVLNKRININLEMPKKGKSEINLTLGN